MKVILNGLSLDKTIMHNVIQKMEDDKEIKNLIKKARFDLIIEILISVFAISIFLGIIYGKLSIFLITFGTLTFATFLLWLLPYFNILRGLLKTSKDLKDYIKFIRSSNSPKKPLDLWGFFISNLSDSHSLIPALKLAEKDIKYIYCGQPYYEIKFIDSILFSISPKMEEKYSIKKTYSKFYKLFAMKTFKNEMEKKYFQYNTRELLQSKYVFGIFYLSNFLYEIIKNKSNEKFNFKIADEIGDKLEYAKECIKLSSDPERTIFNQDSTSKTIDITVKNIFMLKDEIPKKIAKNEMLIPFKRYIALPTRVEGNYKRVADGDIILPEIPALTKNKDTDIDIYSLGGAEHNLPLLHIINCHRYLSKGSRKFGIVENKFDAPPNEKKHRYIDFRVGASHFVYGINSEVKHRMIEDISEETDNSNQAEVFRLKINNYNIFSFYGYSAPMTRIAFLKFLYEMKNKDSKFIPKENEFRLYEVDIKKSKNIYESEFLNEWDRFDCMNEPEKFLTISKCVITK